MKRYDSIDTAEARLEMAKAVAADFERMEARQIGDYQIIDDGGDLWIARQDSYDEAVESILESILSGDLEPDEDDGYQPAYDTLCREADCIYSRNGSPSDLDDLIGTLDMDCDTDQMLDILAALYLADDDLPAMIYKVWNQGERYHGGNAVEVAREWIDAGFDADNADEWMNVGFWSADKAAAIRDAGMDPVDAQDAATSLIDEDDSSYTDGCPIYSICNGDTTFRVLIDRHHQLTADSE